MATGCEVLDLGVVPTPAIQYAVEEQGAAGGVMITASHNPPEFNGIKCIDPDGTEMSRRNEETIEMHLPQGGVRTRRMGIASVGRDRIRPRPTSTSMASWQRSISAAIRKANLRIAVDCSNGAAAYTTPRLLETAGRPIRDAERDPNGAFPGHNSEPTPENTEGPDRPGEAGRVRLRRHPRRRCRQEHIRRRSGQVHVRRQEPGARRVQPRARHEGRPGRDHSWLVHVRRGRRQDRQEGP